MTVVVWKEFRVRVKVMAPSLEDTEDCFEEMKSDIRRAVHKKVLSKRYHAEVLAGPVREEQVDP